MYTLFHQHKITFDLHVNDVLALGNQTAYQNTYLYIELYPGKIGLKLLLQSTSILIVIIMRQIFIRFFFGDLNAH